MSYPYHVFTRRSGLSLALLGLLTAVTGCHRLPFGNKAASQSKTPVPAAKMAVPAPPPAVAGPSDAELKKIRPDEVGLIPVLEYHDLGGKLKRMSRSVELFKKDLDRLYKLNYRPISMAEYLDSRIALPAGKSPVLLTFDDGIKSQFNYLPDGSLDPNCAIAILQEFSKAHPDFPLKATFFVLPDRAFDQADSREQKMQELVKMGFDIGNHTVHHYLLRRLSDEAVKREIAGGAAGLKALAPDAKIETLALPGGVEPRNRALLKMGSSDGNSYTNRAVFLAGAGPTLPLINKKCKPMALPRILAVEESFGLNDWLNRMKTMHRYVSDGDPNTISVPKSRANLVDKSRLKGQTVRVY